MTDTPISDAAASTSMFIDGQPVVEIKICRELERELAKSHSDAAAMREALESLVRFRCECSGGDKCGHCKARSALSGNAGRELLAESQRLRDELKSAREEVERAKAYRNKSGVVERKKYLPTIRQLTADLAKAQAQCAELRSEVQRAYYEGHIHAISSDPELDPQEHSWPNEKLTDAAVSDAGKHK